MPYILAIDQGGTKTDALVAGTDGKIVGYGNDRDQEPVTGERRAKRMVRIRYAAQKALKEAKLSLNDISSVSASCIGADWPFEYELGKRNIQHALGIQDVHLYNDCIGALRGGTEISNRDCAVICLGTGANCALNNRSNRQYIYHYYMKKEHQGAYAIGNFVFQSVFDAEAGLGPKTVLTELLLEEAGYSNVDEMFMHITTGRTENEPKWEPVYQAYSPLFFQAVHKGDTVALEYLDNLCRELARYIETGAKRLDMDPKGFPVVLSGGVPKGGAIMRERLEHHLRTFFLDVECIEARLEPVAGALLLGYDRIYTDGIPKDVQTIFEQNCLTHRLIREVHTA
jgi:N-acetylglucosamine kinase-like BadF-type ATPase